MTCNWENKDCCELLSAYLDGEVTAAERQQVEEWLANDPRMRQLHRRLLKLHHGWQTIPTCPEGQSNPQLAHGVFAKIDQRKRQQSLIFGGGAIAALLIATVSSLFFSESSPSPQIAQKPQSTTTPTTIEPLQIAVNRPVVPIPAEVMVDR